MIRFECGKHPNDGLKITDAETGEDLTGKIGATKIDVLVSMRHNKENKARMEIDAGGLDVLVDHVDVTIIEPGKEVSDGTIWRDFDIEQLSKNVVAVSDQIRMLTVSLENLTMRSVEQELLLKVVRGRVIATQERIAESLAAYQDDTK